MLDEAPLQGQTALPEALQVPAPAETRVFVVDDDEEVMESVAHFLSRQGYDVRDFSRPGECLEALSDDPPAILVTDKDMPGMSGLELMEKSLEVDPTLEVILMTGAGDESSAQAALQIGAANYLTKPLNLRDLGSTVSRSVLHRAEKEYRRRTHMWMKAELERQRAEILELTNATLSALINAFESRSDYLQGHSERTAQVAVGIAREIGLPEERVEAIRIGGLLHDIGMVAVPDELLFKEEPMTPEERAALRQHPQRGADIIEPLLHLEESARYVLEHHERWDGSGYALGLEGDAISLGGQVVGLAETWTTMLDPRPDRPGVPPEEAMRTLEGEAGKTFQARLVEALGATQR